MPVPHSRKTLFNEDIKEKLLVAIQTGVAYRHACAMAGLSYETFKVWMKKGRDEIVDDDDGNVTATGAWGEFLLRVGEVEHLAVVNRHRMIEKIAAGGFVTNRETITKPDGTQVIKESITKPEWQAYAWLQERRYPEEYSLQVKNVNKTQGEIKITIEYPEDWRHVEAADLEVIDGEVKALPPAPSETLSRSPSVRVPSPRGA